MSHLYLMKRKIECLIYYIILKKLLMKKLRKHIHQIYNMKMIYHNM